MKAKSDSGFRIYKGAPGPCTTAEALLQALASLLGFFACALPLLYAFWPGELASPAPAMCVGAAVCLAMAAARRFGGTRFAMTGALALLAAFTLVFLSKITDGACLCWNAWCSARTAATGELLLGRTVLAAAQEQGTCAVLFSVVCAAALALLSDGLAASCRAAAPLLGAGLTLFALLALRPERLPAEALIGAFCAALLLALPPRGQSGRSAGLAALSFAGAAAALAAAAAICAMLPGLRDGSAFLALRSHTLEQLHAWRYESGADGLPEGDFSSLGGKTGSGRTMLSVSMDRAEPMYLHGFVGQSFTGSGWAAISNETLAESGDLLYVLHAGGFYPQTQTGAAALSLGETPETNGVRVINQAACRRYVYAPYSAVSGSFAAQTPARRLTDGSILTNGGKDSSASFSVIYQASGKTADWVQALSEADNAAAQRYLELESGYRAFVEAHFLDIPEQTRALLAPALDEIAAARAGGQEMDAYLAVQCAQDFLDQSLSYSEDTSPLPAGENFVKYTLEAGKGYDFQYATLGVLALRYYGVPARYAEGYIVTEQLSEEAAQGGAQLTDNCAHAWVEVYQEGVGWLPLEMTPNYTELLGAAPQAGRLGAAISERQDAASSVGTEAGEGKGAFIKNGAEYDPEPEQNAKDDEQDGDSPQNANTPRTQLRRAVLLALGLLLTLLAALVLLLVLRRRRVLRQRTAQFEDENVSDAICWRFAHCERLLKKLGLDRGCGSILKLGPQASQQLGQDYGEEFMHMALLNREALFSSHEMTGRQQDEMAQFCEQTTQLLKQRTKPMKRLRLKWIECLY